VLKDSLCRMVRAECDAQYEAHSRAGSASDAVRRHLKAAYGAACRLAKSWAEKRYPAGLGLMEQGRFEERHRREVARMAACASQEVHPHFHWIEVNARRRHHRSEAGGSSCSSGGGACNSGGSGGSASGFGDGRAGSSEPLDP
jgi:uncharacterized membrane protein YgcG